WQECSPSTIPDFSAAAYFFGRDLFQHQNIPIGLINTSWGGTIAEAWMSAESAETLPEFTGKVKEIKAETEVQQKQIYLDKLTKWEEKITAVDSGYKNKVAIWTETNFDDSSWKTMSLPGTWEKKLSYNFDGIAWFRKQVTIPANWAGKDLKLSFGVIDNNDITFFNGEKIGSTEGNTTPREYIIPARLVKSGTAVITVRVLDLAGEGGFYGEKMSLGLSDSEKTLLTGDWKCKFGAGLKALSPVPTPISQNPNRPTVLYNAMIHPLVPYSIRGAIWYQGESNAGRSYQYREIFPLMIKDWRKQWNKDLPFYFVQLANYMKIDENPVESGWAELREAQTQTLNLGNTGMAVIIDIGETNDIHPKNKQEVGRRLALAARANTYGEKIAFSGPIYTSSKIEGNKIRISFKHTNDGLKTKDGQPLKGFAMAGSDHKFHWAEATIVGNEVVVSCPEVPSPLAVRYAWGNNPICNLYNGAGLPASPFRTDDWQGITFGKK
ncbi:MAG: sialate O-acetylesterase, partial [Bacteroidales bacterium]|nr:sialate O-acetylesterase [Bacteroidales bacterium]